MVNDKDYDKKSYHAGFQDGYAEAKEMFKRPQGKWIFDTMGGMVCDKCQTLFLRIANPYNFCPDCGADMRKGGAKMKGDAE